MSDSIPDELSVLAGEYVLGVLDAAETASVARQAEIEPQLSRAITQWEAWLAPLAGIIPPVAPPASLWTRIEQSVGSAAAPAAPTGFHRPQLGMRFWRGATVVSLAMAAVFAAIAFLPRVDAPPRLAALTFTGAPAPAFLAVARADGAVILTAVSPARVPAGRDLELWVLPKGSTTVASVGVLPPTGRRLTLPHVTDGMQLLVTLEQLGGSPTGKPTTPVLYGGTLITR